MPNEKISLPLFFVLLFTVCWIGALPMILGSYGWKLATPLKLLQILMLFGPLIVACFASWMNEGGKGIKNLFRRFVIWRVNLLWYFIALLSPPIASLISAALCRYFGWGKIVFPSTEKMLISFLTTLLVYALLNTEEFAWRGYALPRLQARIGAFRSTMVLAILWAAFHAPLFAIKGGHPAGYPIWLFAVMVFAISPLFTIVFNGSGGSLLLPHILHQSFNAAVEAIPIYPRLIHNLAAILILTGIFFIVSAVLWKQQAPKPITSFS
jgi:membrane protease YdiL (CAAX protease family)